MRTIKNHSHSLRSALLATVIVLAGCATRPDWPEPQITELAPVPTGDRRADVALKYLKQGDPGLAIAELQKIATDGASSNRVLNLLGAAYDQIGRHDLARDYFKRALVLQPESAEILHNIGYSYYLESKYEEARVYFRQAVGSADPEIQAQARGRLMVIASRLPERVPEMQVRQVSDAGLVRTGERSYELRTSCGDCEREKSTATAPVQSTTVARQTPLAVVPAVPELRSTLEVSNGAGRRKLAARVGGYLLRQGIAPQHISNADNFQYARTVVVYPQSAAETATRLAAALPVDVVLELRSDATRVRLILGADILSFDQATLQPDLS